MLVVVSASPRDLVIPSIRRPEHAKVSMYNFASRADARVGNLDDVEALLSALEPLLATMMIAGYRSRSCVLVVSADSSFSEPTEIAVDLVEWWVRLPISVEWDPRDPHLASLGSAYLAVRAAPRRTSLPDDPTHIPLLGARFADGFSVEQFEINLDPIAPDSSSYDRWSVVELDDLGRPDFDSYLRDRLAIVARSWIGTIADDISGGGLLPMYDPGHWGHGPSDPTGDGLDAVAARLDPNRLAASHERAAWLREELGVLEPGDDGGSGKRTVGPSALDRIDAARAGDAAGVLRDIASLIGYPRTVLVGPLLSPMSSDAFEQIVTRHNVEHESWTQILLRLHRDRLIDLLAEIDPPVYPWNDTTVGNLLGQFLGPWLADVNATPDEAEARVLEWLDILGESSLPAHLVLTALICAAPVTIADGTAILQAAVDGINARPVSLPDTCAVDRLARFGICYMREALFMRVAPDVFEFWLDGRASHPGALPSVTFQFPPGLGELTPVECFELPSAIVVDDHLVEIEPMVERTARDPLWRGIRDRLRAPRSELFPPSQSDGSPPEPIMGHRVPIFQVPTRLHTDGIDVIYPPETSIQFRLTSQGASEIPEIVDYDLYPLGGMSVVSEVEISAVPATRTMRGVEMDGWDVTLNSWRIRVWDSFDFNLTDKQAISLGPDNTMVVSDTTLLDLQNYPCAEHPPPAGFLTITDEWTPLNWTGFSLTNMFVSTTTLEVSDYGPDGNLSALLDFFDPLTGEDAVHPSVPYVDVNPYFLIRTEPVP